MKAILRTNALNIIVQAKRGLSTKGTLKKTVFHDLHVKNGARMVEFAGYKMPLQYDEQSIIDSHNHVRKSCGLFDVSHMLQVRICGLDRQALMETLTVADLAGLHEGQGTLSLYTNPAGGIMDDVIVSRCREPHYYVVSNAGCADKIMPHLQSWISKFQKQGRDVRLESIDNGLLALQGPKMTEVLQPGLDFSLSSLRFMHGRYTSIFGIPDCRVTRCGYTGEDGVEISVPRESAVNLAGRLLKSSSVQLVGLGARDTLRLEAGLCLYGNDIDETTSPVEAGLLWTVGKPRRTGEGVKFLGFDPIMAQQRKQTPVTRKRVGFMMSSGPPARAGSKILSPAGETIGLVTSGCMSPFLRMNIAMGYVAPGNTKVGTEVQLEIRGKMYPATVAKMPFTPSHYYTGN